MVQWLELCASTAEGLGSIPGQGTKILQSIHCGQKSSKNFFKKENFLQVKMPTRSGKSNIVC